MARYSAGGSAVIWLEAFNGGRHVVERVGSGSIVIDTSVGRHLGGFQPDKLARSFKGDEDGIYAGIYLWLANGAGISAAH